jgi:hypothetical protein
LGEGACATIKSFFIGKRLLSSCSRPVIRI